MPRVAEQQLSTVRLMWSTVTGQDALQPRVIFSDPCGEALTRGLLHLQFKQRHNPGVEAVRGRLERDGSRH